MLLVHYGLVAGQTPVNSCRNHVTMQPPVSIQQRYLPPCIPTKRASFAFWTSMEPTINDQQTIQLQVNTISKIHFRQTQRERETHTGRTLYYVHIFIFLFTLPPLACSVAILTTKHELSSGMGKGCAYCLILGLKMQFSIFSLEISLCRFIVNVTIGWQSMYRHIHPIDTVIVYYGHLFIHCDIPLKWIHTKKFSDTKSQNDQQDQPWRENCTRDRERNGKIEQEREINWERERKRVEERKRICVRVCGSIQVRWQQLEKPTFQMKWHLELIEFKLARKIRIPNIFSSFVCKNDCVPMTMTTTTNYVRQKPTSNLENLLTCLSHHSRVLNYKWQGVTIYLTQFY